MSERRKTAAPQLKDLDHAQEGRSLNMNLIYYIGISSNIFFST